MDDISQVKERVRTVFQVGDRERKGFIVKRDMQRMLSEVPISAEQLEQVFDSLDEDKLGYLTIEKFMQGFGSHLGSDVTAPDPTLMDQYQPLIDRISHTRVLDNTLAIRHLCDDVSEYGSQQLQVDLEAMLIDLLRDLRRQMTSQQVLEERLKTQEKAHSLELRKLFDEMDFHLNDAKTKMAAQIEHRLRQVRFQLEDELAQKCEDLKEVTSQKHRVSLRLHIMKASEAALRRDNATLTEEKADLEETRDRLSRDMRLLRKKMEKRQAHEQTKQMAAGFRLAQTIIAEEQGLLQQLRILKSIVSTLEEGRHQDVDINTLTIHQEND